MGDMNYGISGRVCSTTGTDGGTRPTLCRVVDGLLLGYRRAPTGGWAGSLTSGGRGGQLVLLAAQTRVRNKTRKPEILAI
jgi:hypothetical protein